MKEDSLNHPHQHHHFNQYLAWSIAGLIYSLSFFIRVSPNTLQLVFQNDLHLDFQQLGYVSAAFYYSYALFQIIGTLLSFRFSLLSVFWAYLLIFGIGLGIFIGAQSYESALWGRILMGMGCSLDFTFCLFLARSFFHKHHFALFVGLTNLFGVIGGCLAQYPLDLLLGYVSWRYIFEILLALFGCAAVALYVSVHYTNVKKQERPCAGKLAKELYAHKYLFLLILWFCFTMVLPILMIPEMWGSLFLETIYGMNSLDASIVLSYFFVGIGIGNLTLGLLRHHYPLMKIIRLALIIETICCVLFIYGGKHIEPGYLPIFSCIIGITASALLLFFDVVNNIFDDGRLALSSLNIFMTLLSASSHPLVGWYLDLNVFKGVAMSTALLESFSVMPIFLLISSIVALTVRSKRLSCVS